MSGRCAAAVFLLFATAAPARSAPAPEAAVRQLQEGYVGAWKRADPQAIARYFAADGDFINPTGVHATGRAAIAGFYQQAFAMGYKGSNAGFTPRLTRTIAPGVVVIDGEWFIEGARQPDGAPRPSERGLATAVLVSTQRGWEIAALREQDSGTRITGP